jgi:DNA-binding MarR family transcriptional regulator
VTPPASGHTASPDWRQAFVQELRLLDRDALPRAATRIIGWLVVCDPPHQAGADLQRELQMSAGAVSTATSLLARLGLIDRLAFPGDRKAYYRLSPDAWDRTLRRHLELFHELRQLADAALVASGDEATDRLRAMRASCARGEGHVAPLQALFGVSP